jgi:ribonucleoside-diphosphate reductase alpha chain
LGWYSTYDFSYDYKGDVLEMKVKEGMEGFTKAGYSAYRERSLGLGAMGFHTFLQSKGVPMESVVAMSWNKIIFKHIHAKALESNLTLGKERGSPNDMKGTGKRFAHMLAIAPNASSSIICGGVSPSIEPLRANAFTQKTLSGSALMKNPNLEKLLQEK